MKNKYGSCKCLLTKLILRLIFYHQLIKKHIINFESEGKYKVQLRNVNHRNDCIKKTYLVCLLSFRQWLEHNSEAQEFF